MRGVPRSLVRFGVVAIAAVTVGVLTAGLPTAPGRRTAAVGLLALAVAGWLAALRPLGARLSAVLLVGTGLAGAGLNVLQPSGPAFVIGYMAMAGLALRLPRRLALATGAVVLVAIACAQAATSSHPLAAAVNVGLGAGFLFVAGSFAAMNREARDTAEALLAQEAATRAARDDAAALAERARLARELHDVLAHTLSGLAVSLEGARLLADATGADPRLAEQVTRAQALARDGMGNAKRAVSALRGDALPGPALLPQLVSEVRATAGVPVTLTVSGAARPLVPEAGLALYRTVQEALTNTAKYAGRGAGARVRVSWTDGGVEVEIVDSGGGASPTVVTGGSVVSGGSVVTGGYGLAGVAERAALLGGHAEAGPVDGGFRVHLRLPLVPTPPNPDNQPPQPNHQESST